MDRHRVIDATVVGTTIFTCGVIIGSLMLLTPLWVDITILGAANLTIWVLGAYYKHAQQPDKQFIIVKDKRPGS